jgi:hypothetical protein
MKLLHRQIYLGLSVVVMETEIRILVFRELHSQNLLWRCTSRSKPRCIMRAPEGTPNARGLLLPTTTVQYYYPRPLLAFTMVRG